MLHEPPHKGNVSMTMPTPQQTRTAWLGLERFLQKTPAPVKAPVTTPNKADRFRVPEKDVIHGAYFWVPKETAAFDAGGRPYPEKIRGNTSVEATGRKKDNLVEIRYKNGRVWVALSDLRKPLQSRAANVKTKTATKSPEDAYESARTLTELLRVLLEGETGQSLKTTGKTKAALSAMEDVIAAECSGYAHGGEDARAFVRSMVPSTMSQKAGIAVVNDLIKNRSALATEILNTKTQQKATGHAADLFILLAATEVVKLKGDTKARAKFLFDTVPQIAMRAGGSGLQEKLVKSIRKAIPWKDATKMRQQRGLEASVKPQAKAKKTAALNDLDVINAFSVPRPLPTTGTYHDLVFDWLRKNGPERGWNEMPKVEDALIVLTSAPACIDSKAPRLEKSKQLQGFIQDMRDRLTRDYGFDRVYAPQAENATLQAILDGIVDVPGAMALTQLVTHSTWYGQLVVNGRPNGDMNAAYALYALAYFRIAEITEDDITRASAFISGVSALLRFRLVQSAMLLARLRYFFPWTVVSTMLRYRMG